MNPAQQQALIIAGELAGLASRLDTDALEAYLVAPDADFLCERLCRAAIIFTKAVMPTEEKRRRRPDFFGGSINILQ
jgi:hypothetical protein